MYRQGQTMAEHRAICGSGRIAISRCDQTRARSLGGEAAHAQEGAWICRKAGELCHPPGFVGKKPQRQWRSQIQRRLRDMQQQGSLEKIKKLKHEEVEENQKMEISFLLPSEACLL